MSKFEFDSIIYPFDNKTAINIWKSELYHEYVRYIQNKKLTQAKITLPSLDILYDCPTLQYLHIHPNFVSQAIAPASVLVRFRVAEMYYHKMVWKLVLSKLKIIEI